MYQIMVTTQGAPRLMRPAHFHNTIDDVQSATASKFGQNPAGASIVSSTKYITNSRTANRKYMTQTKITFRMISQGHCQNFGHLDHMCGHPHGETCEGSVVP